MGAIGRAADTNGTAVALLIAAGHNTGRSDNFTTTRFTQQDAVACLIPWNWCSARCEYLTAEGHEHQKGNGGQDKS
jgi:hypothetical protein